MATPASTPAPTSEHPPVEDSLAVLDYLVNQHRRTCANTARTVDAAAELYAATEGNYDYQQRYGHLTRDYPSADDTVIPHPSGLLAEIAIRLHMSKAAIQDFIDIGTTLARWLPHCRQSFLAGDFTLAHARIIHRRTNTSSALPLRAIDRSIARAAGRKTPRALGEEIDRLLHLVDPDAIQAARKHATENRSVRKTNIGGGMAEIIASMTAEDAEVCDAVLTQCAEAVCPGDPRTLAQRRSDQLLRWVYGQGDLVCECGNPDCPHTTGDPEAKPLAKVILQVVCDPELLLGLAEGSGYLHGHGPISAELVRELAKDATWQALFTEARTRSTHDNTSSEAGSGTGAGGASPFGAKHPAGYTAPPAPQPAPEPKAQEPPVPAPAPGPEAAAAEIGAAETNSPDDCAHEPPPPVSPDPDWGAIDPDSEQFDYFYDDPTEPPREPDDSFTPAQWAQREEDMHAAATASRLAAHFSTGHPPHPTQHSSYDCCFDGHGSHTGSIEALTYTPSVAVRRLVRMRDGTCRFPGCSVKASACEIDHLVPFDHHHPTAGGWTIPENLQCLCKFHHQLKTFRMFSAHVLDAGMTVAWVDSHGQVFTTRPQMWRTDGIPPCTAKARIRNPRARKRRRPERAWRPRITRDEARHDKTKRHLRQQERQAFADARSAELYLAAVTNNTTTNHDDDTPPPF